MSVGAVNKQTGERIPTAGMPAVDSVLSESSTNPVQNRVVKAALDEKTDTDIVASDFSAATSYTAGEYCIYGGKFYKFKNNHSGAWAAADVDEIKIAGELASLKSGLTNGLVFEPYGAQPPSSNPFDENGSGYVLNVVYHGTALGYVILRPKNFADGSGRHNAIELYDTSWNLIWRVLRSDT